MRYYYILLCLLLFVFIISLNSSSYASVDYTYFNKSTFNNSKIDFLYEVVNEFLGFELDSFEFVRENDNSLKSNLIRDIYNYSNFFIVNQSKYNNNNIYGKGIRVWLYNNDFSSGGIRYNIYYANLNAYYVMDSSTANSINVSGTLGNAEVDKFLYIDNNFYNSIYNNIIIEQKLTFKPYNNNIQTIENISDIHIENFSRTVNDWRLGTLSNFDNYTKGFIEMYLGNDNWVQVGSLNWNSNGEVYLNNYRYYYYQLYRIYFYDKDFNYTKTYGYYFMPLGEVYNGQGLIYSGDNNNLNVPIINELQENQNFWEGVYNDLFNMNSGDASEVYNLVSSYFPSGETPISIYDTIFGSINNDPDDFIIRWDDIPLHITWFNGEVLYSGDFIKANSINISKTCRENEVLRLIKFYINLFVCIGFLITYYFKMYNLMMLIIVGVVPDIVSNTDNDDYKRNEIGFKM